MFSIRIFTRDGSPQIYSDGFTETTDGLRDSGKPGRATKLPRDEFASLLGKGDILIMEGNDFLGAEPLYWAALTLAKESARKEPGNGEVAAALGKSTEAKGYFLEALKHSETFGDGAHIRNCLFSLGDFHQKQGEWQEALGYYERMMKLVDEDDQVYIQQRINDVREKLGG